MLGFKLINISKREPRAAKYLVKSSKVLMSHKISTKCYTKLLFYAIISERV